MKRTLLLGLFAQSTLLIRGNTPAAWTPPPNYSLYTSNHKVMYLADISVGSSGQAFRVLVDTGSSVLVLPAKSCITDACMNHHRFAAADSTTAEQSNRTLAIGFGLGKVEGHVFKDQVCLPTGNSASLTEVFLQASVASCAKTAFLASDTESTDFANAPYDGIFGLGLDSGEGDDFSFLKQLVVASKISSTTFALHLGNDGQSSLSLGGVDESQLASGRTSWWDLSSYANGYWQFSACDITLDGVPQNFGRIEVAVDSGTSLLAADDDLKGWLHQKLQLEGRDGCTNVDRMPRVGLIRHDGSSLELFPSDYVDQTDGACSLAIMPNFQAVNGQRLILGDSFLRRYVTLFDRDNKRLGFGVSVDDDNAPQLVEALFPTSAPTSSACEDHQLNKAFSNFAEDLVDEGGFQQELTEQATQVTAIPAKHAKEKVEAIISTSSGTERSSSGNQYLSYLKLVQLHGLDNSETQMDVQKKGQAGSSGGRVIKVPLQRRSIKETQA